MISYLSKIVSEILLTDEPSIIEEILQTHGAEIVQNCLREKVKDIFSAWLQAQAVETVSDTLRAQFDEVTREAVRSLFPPTPRERVYNQIVGTVSTVVRQEIEDHTRNHNLVLGAPGDVVVVAGAPVPVSPLGSSGESEDSSISSPRDSN